MNNKVGKFTGAEVIASCPSLGRSAVLGALKKLTDEGIVAKYGSGRATFYVRKDSIES
jgi:predicted transcriptional regulator